MPQHVEEPILHVYDDEVVFSVMDFDNEGGNILFDQFKQQMRMSGSPSIPFSMKFEEIGIIQSAEHPFSYPSNAKISRSHHCICVADDLNKEVKLFDLTSFKFLGKIALSNLCGLFIEEKYDNQHDAIYIGQYKDTSKYRVKDLLNNTKENTECLWKLARCHKFGMAMRKVGNQKQLFRFGGKIMNIIDPESGNVVHSFELEQLSMSLAIIFITPTRMMATCLSSNNCLIYDEVNENQWKLVKIIERADGIKFGQPLGLAIDRKGEKIFLSDYDNKRIVVFNLEGEVLTSYKSNSTTLNPYGIEFDDRTGLLYITDQQNQSIRIFK